MIVWIDAQLPPMLAGFMRAELGLNALALKELGLRDAADRDIFEAARQAGALLMSKDADFVDLVQRLGVPPQLIWVTCGNVTNARLQVLLRSHWTGIAAIIAAGEPIVELTG